MLNEINLNCDENICFVCLFMVSLRWFHSVTVTFKTASYSKPRAAHANKCNAVSDS